MALNLTSRLQVTAHYFWNRRNAAALSHHGVRLEYDPEQRRSAALILGFTFTLLAVALMFVLSWFKPAGQVGKSNILADRDTGAIYVLVDGRLHPALNLTSARLIAGQANNPTFVKAAELAKYPQGPTVGIVGAPAAMPIRTGDASQWAVCDTAPAATATSSAGTAPVVTAIAGPLTLGQRSAPLQMPDAILARYGDKTYVIWDGHRSEIDLSNKAVALALGVDSTAPEPVPLSKALFDALPATDPLVSPAVPRAGEPVAVGHRAGRGDRLGAVGARSGAVRRGHPLCAVTQWRATDFAVRRVAAALVELVRRRGPAGGGAGPAGAGAGGATACRCRFIRPPGCSWWTPRSTAPPAWRGRRAPPTAPRRSRCCPGQGLPIPVGAEQQLVHLVKDVRDPNAVEADQAFIGNGRHQLGDDDQRRSGRRQPRVAVVDLRSGGALRHRTHRRVAAGAGRLAGRCPAGAVAADPGVRARARRWPARMR